MKKKLNLLNRKIAGYGPFHCFTFLSLERNFRERELEQGLIDRIQKLLLELGHGFAFVGRQYRLEVDGKEFFYQTCAHPCEWS